ncbi:hypothetical protein [Streptomyces subrutilus]|uniref:hypothetical protein n=1 Tax=Streptomyces subrutilus TaxID=36818 RepID=UPI001FCB90FC|nr:hypothetical protein [Streptomyces subrutilus]
MGGPSPTPRPGTPPQPLTASVLPPDLSRLRTLVTYLRGELGRAEQAFAVAEEREAF